MAKSATPITAPAAPRRSPRARSSPRTAKPPRQIVRRLSDEVDLEKPIPIAPFRKCAKAILGISLASGGGNPCTGAEHASGVPT